MEKEDLKKLLIVTLFATAMGFLEAVVVVYLRELYYPGGFTFPLRMMTEKIYLTEIIREASTLVMLLTFGILAGKTAWERFGWFLFSFAVWDILYYVALKVLLNWPESLLTWDILFLIPVVWVGPVLAPVISSLLMIFLCLLILHLKKKGFRHGYNLKAWAVLGTGALLTFISYVLDYTRILLQTPLHEDSGSILNDQALKEAVSRYVPERFAWEWHIAGSILIVASMLLHYSRYAGEKKNVS
ncbi:MAG: hypothetical protein ACP5D1_06170 [Bacteroidales bacterium]